METPGDAGARRSARALALLFAAASGRLAAQGSNPVVTSLMLFAGTGEGLFRSSD